MISASDRRGVSEVIGFVLVFGLITASVGAAYVWGMGGLTDARTFERTDNAQRAMEALADNVDDVVSGGAPSRATEIDLVDARLGGGDPVTVNVSTGSDGPCAAAGGGCPYEVTPVVYDAGDEQIRYVAGAVVRRGEGGAAMARDPGFVAERGRLVVPVVRTTADGSGVGGSGTVLVRTERIHAGVVAAGNATDAVTVSVASPNAHLWKRYLERTGDALWDDCRVDGDRAVCTATDADVDLYLTRIWIEVGFD